MFFHPTRVKSKAKPARLSDHYLELHRQILQKGLPQPPPCRRMGTRERTLFVSMAPGGYH
jgi:hypothetical protein